jgi:Xaa-Pro aminopeptidase
MALPSTAALAARHTRIRESLETLSLDALIITPPANIRYLSNHAGTAGILVLTRDALHLLVDFRYHDAVRALQESPAACPGLRIWDVPASYEEALIGCLAEIGVTTVGFEAAHVTVARQSAAAVSTSRCGRRSGSSNICAWSKMRRRSRSFVMRPVA